MEIVLSDVDADDPRLVKVAAEPSVWRDGRSLVIAVRRSGDAPMLVGTVHAHMRPAGDGVWALRLDVPPVRGACIEYAVIDPTAPERARFLVWRDRWARREAEAIPTGVDDALPVGTSAIALRHHARLWSPAAPSAVLICADGEGLAMWAGVLAAAREPVALVGIESAGLTHEPGDDYALTYNSAGYPRARAYLRDVDPEYFDAHLRYVLDEVIPWAEARIGRLPRYAFGVSNGAAWAAHAAAFHPDEFSGVLAFSLGMAPARPPRSTPAHALVAGRFEPGFDRETSRYARKLRTRGVAVRLSRPARGHDHTMWLDEFLPALRWVRAQPHH